MDFCTLSSSQTKIELMASGDVAKYMSSPSPVFGFVKRGGELKYSFKSSKAFWYSSIQVKSIICLRVLKNGRYRSADLEINRLRDAIHPTNF